MGIVRGLRSTRLSVQRQFAFREIRHARNVITAGVLGALVSGGVWAFI